MLDNQKLPPAAQFALLIGACGLGIILFVILTGLVINFVLHIPMENVESALLNPANLQVSRLLQVFNAFLMWAFPAIVVAAATGPNPASQLGFSETLSAKQVFFVILMVAAGFVLSGALAELNRMLPLTKQAARYFQGLEDDYTRNVMAMANMKTINDYIFSLVVLAVVPALFEEMFFRGALQQVMVSWTRHAFLGIFITSFLFSAIHLSYYGFLPRLCLGMVLGYIFYFSKNLWLSVLAHFLNNAYSLTMLYMLSRAGKLTPDALNDEYYPLYYGLIGGAAIVLLFYVFKKESSHLLQHTPAIIDSADKV